MTIRRIAGMQFGLGAAALGVTFGLAAHSLADPASLASAPAEQQKAEKETELRGVEDTIRASEEQRRAIESEMESIRADRARLSVALIETTAKVQDAERGVAAADERLAALNTKADSLSRSLESRRDAIAEVLAALQRMGANPPPAILIKPQDMAEAVRAASLLSSTIPDLRSQAEALARDIDELSTTRESIARARDSLTRTRVSLGLEKARLSELVEARQQALSATADALGSQQKRAADLAGQAASLKDLIARLNADDAKRRALADAARAADQQAAQDIALKAEDARGEESVRLKPEVAFAEIKGRVRLPVAGSILKTFGTTDGLGGTERGVSMSTLPGAIVSAPADGSVLFCGPYRTYGQLLIINAGEAIMSCSPEWNASMCRQGSSF